MKRPTAPRISRASDSEGTQQKGVFTMGQGIGTGEPTLIDPIYLDDEAAPTAEQVAKVVAKVPEQGLAIRSGDDELR